MSKNNLEEAKKLINSIDSPDVISEKELAAIYESVVNKLEESGVVYKCITIDDVDYIEIKSSNNTLLILFDVNDIVGFKYNSTDSNGTPYGDVISFLFDIDDIVETINIVLKEYRLNNMKKIFNNFL